ncbi:hypothetical protein BZZ01_25855 [Nostocales cyanobacterium HT-58-2]|nr:hypothetical protein BZZ01_25855 [Nostocales cyanobacterium HT-58-2]
MVKSFSAIENSSELTKLRAEIVSKRSFGEVLFDIKKIIPEASVENSENLSAIINSFVTQLGYSSLGDRWKEIKREEAQQILVFILTKDLAYSTKLMTLEEAKEIDAKLFSFFQSDCKFFTNAVFVSNYSAMSAWDSLTKATFDTGVVILSDRLIGIVWVQDED